jgi:hypothetical protein
MCTTARGSAFLRGELRCCHVSHSPRRAVKHRNKESLSCPRYAARLTYFQGTLVRYQSICRRAVRYSASLQFSVGPAALGTQLGLRVSKARSCVIKAPSDVQSAIVHLYNAASAQLIIPGHGYSDDMTRQDDTTALAMFRTTGWQTIRLDMHTPLKTSFAIRTLDTV